MSGSPSKGRCLPEIITLQKVREVTKNLKNRAMPGAKELPSHEDQVTSRMKRVWGEGDP